jgi:general secretion pathway protein D
MPCCLAVASTFARRQLAGLGLCGGLLLGLSACTLPWQQLGLPGDEGHVTDGLPTGSVRPPGGVPLANTPKPATQRDREYVGSGTFAATPDVRPAAAAPPPRDGVTLNLVDAGIPEAAKAVLGDILRVNYQVSEKVKGTITIQTPRPVSRETLLEMLEAALRSDGNALVVDRGLYRILPAADAVGLAPLRVGRAADQQRGAAGLVTQAIQLRNVAPADMERLLKGMAPASTVIRAEQARNLIIVTGTRSEIAAIAEAVSVFDVDWMRGMSFALFPIETGDPDAIAQELDTIFANDRDSPTKGIVRFVPNRRLRSILVISQRPQYIEKARAWLRRIDSVGRITEKQVHVYHVQNRPAVELAQLLQRVYQSQEQTRAATTGAPQARPASTQAPTPPVFSPIPPQQAQQPPAPQPLPSPGTSAIPGLDPSRSPGPGVALIEPAPATEPAAARQPAPGGLPPDDRQAGISVVADETNNALVITATPREYKRTLRILERIDVMPHQVLLEATIAEVNLNDRLRFGIRWFFQAGNHQLRFTDDTTGAVTPQFPGFSHFFSTPNVQIALNALAAITDVNVVSSPTIMVLDNKKATLQVGDEVPIATQSAVSVLAPGSPIVNSVAFRNTGILLNITPRISDHGRILLDIEQEVSDAVTTTTSTIDSPTIQQRRIKTTIAVGDGEAIVLGGLMQDRATRGRNQIPLIGDIPVVGNLFKSKDDRIVRTELVIAITPRIVKNDHHLRKISAEFRDKLNFSTRPQRSAPPDKHEQIDRILR